MTKTSVKSAILQQYDGLNLMEIETKIKSLEDDKTSTSVSTRKSEITAARYALQQRQRKIKATAMEFEATNSHHLLFFNSTSGFTKLAGRSALFFAATVADRIHWRFSLKADTDHYSPSEDGIIFFRSLDRIHDRLAEINIFPDVDLETPELHYYKLSKVYSDNQISKLRDHVQRDLERIMSIVLPSSPIPTLYDAIMQTSQLVYYQFKHLADGVARDTIGRQMIIKTYQMANEYMQYAHTKDRDDRTNLKNIITLARDLRYGIAYITRLQILHHRDVCKILEQLVTIERVAAKAYLKKDK